MITKLSTLLVATLLLLSQISRPSASPLLRSDCTNTSIGFAPSNYVRSAAYTYVGLKAKAGIVRRDALGQPSATGRIALLVLGMSNAKIVGDRQQWLHDADPDKFPGSQIVNGAVNGQTASDWADPNDPAWREAAEAVATHGLSAQQVQAVHFTLTQKEPLTYGPMTKEQVRDIVSNVLEKYPRVRVIMLSGIAYTGYSTEINRAPEPFVHDDSILLASVVVAGGFPVFVDFTDVWADGVLRNPRTGLYYVCGDFADDGIHPSMQGRNKIAASILARWKRDPVFTGWLFSD